MRYPSVQSIMQIKDVTGEDATRIRAVMDGPRWSGGQTRMQRIDAILRTHGVEFVAAGKGAKSPCFYYCNAGDSYALTIVKIDDRFRVTTWGDIVERGNYE